MNHPGHWALLPRMALLMLASLCCAGAGLALHTQPLSDARSGHEKQLHGIKAEFQGAVRRNAVLPMLQARSEQLSIRLNTGAPRADDAPLQARLAMAAEQSGLALDSFRPLADGAELGVVGDYGALLVFVAELSQSPHCLLFETLDISVQRTATRQRLRMKANVRRQPPSNATNPEPAHP